ncbi:UNVERIFIED_CONTAM: hypothetical protein FKN15_045040 [Acipenser sinensis]
MEEAPAERPKGRAEPVRAEEALQVDPLPIIQQTSEAGPDSTTEGPAAAGVAEGAQEGPPTEHLPRAPPSSDGDMGSETCVAEEGAVETAPEAEVGSAGNAEPMQATPAEGPEGEEEQPLPEKELPLAPISGEEADSASKAGVGSADNAEPMQATPGEGPEGGKEPPQEQVPPRAPEASVGSADNAEPMQAASAEGSEGGEEPPHQEQKLPQASLSCGDGGFGPRDAAEGDEETLPEADAGSAEPALTLVSGARKGGEEPERAEGGALKADPLPEVQRGQETGPQGPVPVTEGAREEPLKEQLPRASLSVGGEGSGPRAAVRGKTEAVPVTDAEEGEGPKRVYPLSLREVGEGPERVDPLLSRAEDGPETVPRTSKEGPRAETKPSGSAAYAERPSAPPKSRVQTVPARVPPPVSPAMSPGGGAQGGPVKLKIRRNAITNQREWVVLYHREGGDGELREEDTESTGSVGSEKDPSPEAVRGSAEEAAEPMEEAPAERPKGREEPVRAERALRVDSLPVIKETSEAGPDSTVEGPAAAEVAEGAQEGPPKEQLPRAPPSSDGDTGPEPCVAEEGVTSEPAPEAEAGSADNVEPMQATSAEGSRGRSGLRR